MADIIQNNSWQIPKHLPVELKAFLHQSSSPILIRGSDVQDTLSWQGDSSGSLSEICLESSEVCNSGGSLGWPHLEQILLSLLGLFLLVSPS